MKSVYESFELKEPEEQYASIALSGVRDARIGETFTSEEKVQYCFKSIGVWLGFLAASFTYPLIIAGRVIYNKHQGNEIVPELMNSLKNEMFMITMAVSLPFYFLYCAWNKETMVQDDPTVLLQDSRPPLAVPLHEGVEGILPVAVLGQVVAHQDLDNQMLHAAQVQSVRDHMSAQAQRIRADGELRLRQDHEFKMTEKNDQIRSLEEQVRAKDAQIAQLQARVDEAPEVDEVNPVERRLMRLVAPHFRLNPNLDCVIKPKDWQQMRSEGRS